MLVLNTTLCIAYLVLSIQKICSRFAPVRCTGFVHAAQTVPYTLSR